MLQPLIVSSDNLDSVLDFIQTSVITAAPMDKVLGAGPQIGGMLNSRLGQNYMTLDLVSHSSGAGHLLLLGDGKPNEPPYLIEHAPRNLWMATLLANKKTIHDLGITQLRLLGCLTACRPTGRSAMQEIKTTLSLNEVFGTTRVLSAMDFDQDGFKDTPAQTALVGTQSPQFGVVSCSPDLPAGAPGVLGLDLGRVPPLPLDELGELEGSPEFVNRSELRDFTRDEVDQLYRAVGAAGRKKGKSLPGLLTVPTWEYWIQVPGSPAQYWLLQILFEWHMVQVYSPDLMISPNRFTDPNKLLTNSAVYPVEDWDGLKRLMTGHNPQTRVNHGSTQRTPDP